MYSRVYTLCFETFYLYTRARPNNKREDARARVVPKTNAVKAANKGPTAPRETDIWCLSLSENVYTRKLTGE